MAMLSILKIWIANSVSFIKYFIIFQWIETILWSYIKVYCMCGSIPRFSVYSVDLFVYFHIVTLSNYISITECSDIRQDKFP